MISGYLIIHSICISVKVYPVLICRERPSRAFDYKIKLPPHLVHTHLQVIVVDVIGKATVLVHQKAEAPFFLKQGFFAAICNELLDFTLARSNSLHIL